MTAKIRALSPAARQRLGLVLILVGVALSALFLAWPTLRFPWALIDDGLDLQATQRLDQAFHLHQFNNFIYIESGRVRPAYWLILWLQYAIAGTQAPIHHAFRILQFVWASWLAVVLARDSFHSNLAGALAGVLFVANARGIELWIRLGPQEPLLIICFGTSLWLLMRAGLRIKSGRTATFHFIISLVFLSIGYFCKETAVVMLPISVIIWLAVGRGWPSAVSQRWRQAKLVYLVANIILTASLAALLAYNFIHRPADSYSTLYNVNSLTRPVTLAGVYLVWLLAPFAVLAPLAVLSITVWRSLGIISIAAKMDADRWSLAWLAWLISFFVIQLPWNLPQSYYIHPMTFGVCVLLSWGLSAIVSSFSNAVSRNLLPWLAAPFILCVGATLAYNVYWLQVDMQHRYAEHITDINLVQTVARIANPKNKLWFDLPPLSHETGAEVLAQLQLFYGWKNTDIGYVTSYTHPASGDLVISLAPGTLATSDKLPDYLHFEAVVDETIGGSVRTYRVYVARALTTP